MLTLERVKELRIESDNERLSWGECAEIEAAFNELPDDQLRDLRENAMIDDMLDELETHLQPKNDVRAVAA